MDTTRFDWPLKSAIIEEQVNRDSMTFALARVAGEMQLLIWRQLDVNYSSQHVRYEADRIAFDLLQKMTPDLVEAARREFDQHCSIERRADLAYLGWKLAFDASPTLALDDEWRTAKPKDQSKGQHYKLDDAGRIVAGFGGEFNGQTEAEAFSDEDTGIAQTASQPHSAPRDLHCNEQTLLKLCAVPGSAHLTALLNDDELGDFLKSYLLGQYAEVNDICDHSEIVALLSGPELYAGFVTPSVDFSEFNLYSNSSKLQRRFNRLEAYVKACQGLQKLEKGDKLTLHKSSSQLLAQLYHRYEDVKQQHGSNLLKAVQDDYGSVSQSLNNALSMIRDELHGADIVQKSAELVRDKLAQEYRDGKRVAYPFVKVNLASADFRSGYSTFGVKTWLVLQQVKSLFSTYRELMISRWGKKRFEANMAWFDKLTYQTEQAIQVYLGCNIDQALTREFSRYDLRHNSISTGDHQYVPEQINGVQAGPAMSFKEADSLNPNSNFNKVISKQFVNAAGKVELRTLKPFNNNCQCGCIAYELRLRGFDVEAKPYVVSEHTGIPFTNMPPQMRLALCSQSVWWNPRTKAYPDVTYLVEQNDRLERLSSAERPATIEQLLKQMIEPGQRFHLAWKLLNRRSGHIVTVEKLRNGDILLYDPQSGNKTTKVAQYFNPYINKQLGKVDARSLRAYRVDDCDIVLGLAEYAVVKKGQAALGLGNAWAHDRRFAMDKDDSGDASHGDLFGEIAAQVDWSDKFDDDIPDYIRNTYAGYDYDAEYCGEYRTDNLLWDVYWIKPKIFRLADQFGGCPEVGYPQYVLLAKGDSQRVMFISDETFEITDATLDQLEQLRKEGHKRRPDQKWV